MPHLNAERISLSLSRTTTTCSARADAQLLTAVGTRLDGEHHAGLDGRPIVDYQLWPFVDRGADLVAAGRRIVEALAPEDPARRGERLTGERAGTERLDRGLERTAGGSDVAVLRCARLSPDHQRIAAGGSRVLVQTDQ